jgi:hypothetical protein
MATGVPEGVCGGAAGEWDGCPGEPSAHGVVECGCGQGLQSSVEE